MNTLDIAEVVAQSGLPPSTLRYYESQGLIQSCGRHGLRRQYDESVLLTLSLIALGKAAGFSLTEIGGMFRDGQLQIPRDELHAKADALGRQIRRLQTLQQLIRHVADCPAPSHLACPNFRKLLNHAGSKARPISALGRASARSS